MKRFILGTLLCVFTVMQMPAQLYFCGATNNWDINKVVEFQVAEDGLYFLTMDFSKGDNFKISTVRPSSTEVGAAWSEFDSGVLGLKFTASINQWLLLTPGALPNICAPAQEELTIYVDMDSKRILFSDGSPLPERYHEWSGTLPVLFINTDGGLPVDSKEEYRKGSYYLDPMGVEGVEALGSKEEPLALQIKGRGNYTWVGFDKKPYRLKFDQKAAIMGLKKSKHFALLANADDNLGFMRNPMGFALSRKLNLPWTPETKPLEVVLNGDYIGLYWLTETIRVDKDRVNVVEQLDLATTDVDGGWLVEIDNYDSDPHVTVTAKDGYNIWFTYKSPEELSPEQESYLSEQMTAINSAVDNDDFNKLAELVDIPILARYYLVQQMMEDGESFHGSCYLNRQRGADNKWMFGPVWDFGNAFQNDRGTDPSFIGQAMFYQVWIPYIYKMPAFKDAVKAEWHKFVSNGCQEVIDELNPLAESIVVASVNDAERWPKYAQTDIMEKYDLISSYLNNSRRWGIEQWGVESVCDGISDDATAPVRYFNLQGVELSAPAPGSVTIMVRGHKAEKVVYNR